MWKDLKTFKSGVFSSFNDGTRLDHLLRVSLLLTWMSCSIIKENIHIGYLTWLTQLTCPPFRIF